MLALLSALIVATVVGWGATRIVAELKASRSDRARERMLDLLQAFASASSAAAADPKAVLVWEPLARVARKILPEDFAQLDRASGSTFPFGSDRIQAAHAQWTADWLAWERIHDSTYKLKAAAIEEELVKGEGTLLLRARLDALEREKLDLYQRRYEEYVRVAKALHALVS
jgi:hypothetical protein